MRARRFLRPRVVRRRTPARRGVCLCSTAAVLLRRADSVLGETRGRSASPARASGERLLPCCSLQLCQRCLARRTDGWRSLGVPRSHFCVPAARTVPLMGINLQNVAVKKPVSIADQAKNGADGYRAIKAPLRPLRRSPAPVRPQEKALKVQLDKAKSTPRHARLDTSAGVVSV